MLTVDQLRSIRQRDAGWSLPADIDPDWASAWDAQPAVDRRKLLGAVAAQADRITRLQEAIESAWIATQDPRLSDDEKVLAVESALNAIIDWD